MQDQGAAGGSAAGAHSAELSKAEKTIESLKYELRQVRPYLQRLFNMDKVLEDLKSDKEKLEGENTRLKRDKDTSMRRLAKLWKQNKELRRKLQKMRRSRR